MGTQAGSDAMTMTLDQLRALDASKYPTPTKPLTNDPVPVPSSFQVTGNTGFFVIQWAPIVGVSGYEIAVMTNKELDTPNIGIFTEYGSKSARHDYLIGNIVATRFFAIRAFRDVDFGPWSVIKSAASILMTTAGAGEPANPASPPSSNPPPPGGGGNPGTEPDPGLRGH